MGCGGIYKGRGWSKMGKLLKRGERSCVLQCRALVYDSSEGSKLQVARAGKNQWFKNGQQVLVWSPIGRSCNVHKSPKEFRVRFHRVVLGLYEHSVWSQVERSACEGGLGLLLAKSPTGLGP